MGFWDNVKNKIDKYKKWRDECDKKEIERLKIKTKLEKKKAEYQKYKSKQREYSKKNNILNSLSYVPDKKESDKKSNWSQW